jgi:alkylation response protein AidB-like acyl-CoA dehydrogenase
MDFQFSPDQDALRAAVRSFLATECSIDFVRAHLETETACSDDLWQRIVELGWPALLVPEADGGLGLGITDLVVVAEETGRALFPGPFLSSAVLATLAARALGLHDRLAALARGTERGSVAIDEAGVGDPVDRTRVRATGRGNRYRLDGTKPVVVDGHTADWVLVPARTAEGLRTFLVENPPATYAPNLDLTRKLAALELDGTPATPVGPRIDASGDHRDIWRRVRDDGAVALAAELIGSSEAAMQVALDYANAREVFGQVLTKYQVTRHKAVDLLREVELAKVGVHYAAWASDADAPDREDAVAMAKSYAAEAANHVGAECIQIHGGVGFTWDCDAHLYLRRAKVNDLLLGAQGWQRERLADSYFAAL